jgi:hypothetical protein
VRSSFMNLQITRMAWRGLEKYQQTRLRSD